MKKKAIAILLGLCMLGITACGNEGSQSPYNVSTEIKGTETEKIILPVAKVADNTLETGINQFAHKLYNELPTDENVFFSPYSICCALSLLDVGAGEETKAEIESMLGITDLDEWNKQMKLYLEKEWTEETKVTTGNSLWISPGMNRSEDIEKAFLQPATFYYHSEMFEADFANEGEKVVKDINKWVDKKTGGMIPKYKDSVDPQTAMLILNAVYFEGKWSMPFSANATSETEVFHSAPPKDKEIISEKKYISMMHKSDVNLRYIQTEKMKGIELPYENSSLVMDILLPLDDSSTEGISLYKALSIEEKNTLWKSFDGAEYENIHSLAMPKFTMDLKIEALDAILQKMGMVSAYKKDANFDAIGNDLFVSSVAHQAKIEVDEEGTKAAAVTEITMKEMAMMIPDVQINFIMDRPFVYVIRDIETGMILFMGQVANL